MSLENKYVYEAIEKLPFVNADGSQDADKAFRKGERFVVIYSGSGEPLFGHVYYGCTKEIKRGGYTFEDIRKLWWYDVDQHFYIGGH